MNIDWLTVIIQGVNFLILVWILKRYLYKPILNAMDNRQKAVFAKLHEAEKRELDAEKARKDFENEKQNVKDKARKVFLDAHKEAEEEKSAMVKDAHHDMQKKQSRFEKQLALEKKALYHAVRTLAGETLVQTARDALGELATKNLESDMISLFVQKISKNTSDDFAQIIDGIKAKKTLFLSSSRKLDSKDKKIIEEALKTLSGVKPTITYKENSDLICGIEILCDTVMIRWGFDKYIENFGRSLNNALNKITA
ncbi:MAG: F0F1 ATP synthase subunit B family protein [Alphaproteobacteria bacterium]